MKCLLHIGSAKTGTTTLQELLYEDRLDLNANGCLYPLSCLWKGDRSHNSLGVYFWDGLFEQFTKVPFLSVLQTLQDEMAPWPNVLVSTELIEKALIHGNANTGTFLKMLKTQGREIEVIYGIRRYDYFLDSLFKQSVCDPYLLYAGSKEDFLKAHVPHIKYGTIAKAWRDAPEISRVMVTPFYENDMRRNLERLLAQMGFPQVLTEGKPIPHTNRSIEGDYLRLRHALNKFNLPTNLNHEFARLATSPAALKSSPTKTSLFSGEERAELIKSYTGDRKILIEEFGVDLGAWRDYSEPESVPFVPLPAEEIPDALKLITDLDENVALEIERHLNLSP